MTRAVALLSAVITALFICDYLSPLTIPCGSVDAAAPPAALAVQPITRDNKWRERDPVAIENLIFGLDASTINGGHSGEKGDNENGGKTSALNGRCHFDVDLLWKAQLGAPITTTPIIADIDLSTISPLSSASSGWGAFAGGGGSNLLNHASEREIIVATQDHYVEAVRGLDGRKVRGFPFAFARSHFQSSPLLFDRNGDGQDDLIVTTTDGEIVFLHSGGTPMYGETLKIPPLRVRRDWYADLEEATGAAISLALHQQPRPLHIDSHPIERHVDSPNDGPYKPNGGRGRQLLAVEDDTLLDDMARNKEGIWKDMQGSLTTEGIESFELFLTTNTPASYVSAVEAARDPLYAPTYQLEGATPEFIDVDAHVLATPLLANIDDDPTPELIVAVSYYFDTKEYSHPEAMARLPTDTDISKYVGGGIIVFDLAKRRIKFNLPLDLSTDQPAYRAHMYATPTVADIDKDGEPDIFVPTALGYIYRIHPNGTINYNGFPQMMDSIYAPLVIDDVTGDGRLDIIAADINSNVACFSGEGQELWSNRVSGVPEQAPVLADIDGDQRLDVILTTNAGHIWALHGETGEQHMKFPIKVGGRIYARPLVVSLALDGSIRSANQKGPRQHIAVTAGDGRLYVIDTALGCVESVDIGEHSYGMVLADDVTGDGVLDLVIGGNQGNLFVLQTSVPFHPLKAWREEGRASALEGWRGVYVLPNSRAPDVAGKYFGLYIAIEDVMNPTSAPYNVSFTLHNKILNTATYTSPGIYWISLPCPDTPLSMAMLSVKMTNGLGQSYSDAFPVSCNRHFAKSIKWILVLPFLCCALVLLFLKDLKAPLPTSFSREMAKDS